MNINSETVRKIGGDKYDILKFILALLIFSLHSNLLPIYFRPFQRMAVPLFFMMSSNFFFSKLRQLPQTAERNRALVKYLKRIFLLLLFWTVVFIIPLNIQRHWSSHPFPLSVLSFLQSLASGRTFIASWFLSSTIIATTILYWTIYKARMATWLIFCLSLSAYLICCRFSLYSGFFPLSPMQQTALNVYQQYLGVPYNSFPAALVWIFIGKMIAYEELRLTKRVSLLLSCAGFMLLLFEYTLVYLSADIAYTDCSVSLLIVCPAFFMYFSYLDDINIKHARLLRKHSVVIFCTHGSFLIIYHLLFITPTIIPYLTLTSCLLTGMFVIHYSNRIQILRYSH